MPAKRMTRNITHVIKKSSDNEKPETPTRPNRYNQPVGNTSPERIFGVLTRSTSRVHTRYIFQPDPKLHLNFTSTSPQLIPNLTLIEPTLDRTLPKI